MCNFTQILHFMIKKNKLIKVRNKKSYSQEYMATSLEINTSSYSRKENGKIKISKHDWQKLSEILEVSLEEIYEPDENIVIFNDNPSGDRYINVTNYVIPQSMWESQKRYIEKLEKEIINLKKENLSLKLKLKHFST